MKQASKIERAGFEVSSARRLQKDMQSVGVELSFTEAIGLVKFFKKETYEHFEFRNKGVKKQQHLRMV